MDSTVPLVTQFWIILILIHKILANGHITVNQGVEYCSLEKFNVTCGREEVILIERARYGRMKLCRCVKENLGYLGCNGNALSYVDAMCSGKRDCSFSVPNQELGKFTNCPSDTTPYLEVLHRCVTVIGKEHTHCLSPLTMDEPEGYVSSLLAKNDGLGTRRCPWGITVRKGQRIEVRLAHSAPVGLSTGCQRYGTIVDRKGNREVIRICPEDKRQKHLFTSATNQLEILFDSKASLQEAVPIVLKYEATGCADIPEQPGRLVTRTDDDFTTSLEIRCNNSGETWFVTCKDNKWRGIIGNCTEGSKIGLVRSQNYSFPYKIVLVVAIGVALGIFMGGTLLLCASVLIKRKSLQRRQQMYEYGLEYKVEHPPGAASATLQRHTCHYADANGGSDEDMSKTNTSRDRLGSDDFVLSSEQFTEQGGQKAFSPNNFLPPYQTNGMLTQQPLKANTVAKRAGHIYEYPKNCPK